LLALRAIEVAAVAAVMRGREGESCHMWMSRGTYTQTHTHTCTHVLTHTHTATRTHTHTHTLAHTHPHTSVI